MNTSQLEPVISKLAQVSRHEFNQFALKDKFMDTHDYRTCDIDTFVDHLAAKSERINLALLRNHIAVEDFDSLVRQSNFPVLVFQRNNITALEPILIYNNDEGNLEYYHFGQSQVLADVPEDFATTLAVYEGVAEQQVNGEVIFVTVFPMNYIAQDYFTSDKDGKELTPFQRLMRLLRSERREIGYIYIYAVMVSIISLTLPLGIQATVSLISGGMFFSSVVVMIGIVILGILLSGGLQIMQITLVETLQQRIFVKSAFEFAFRVPRMRLEYLNKYYPPELMNRFFDVMTVQKGLPKLFVEITAAVLQVFLGLVLLSFYHPFFLIFSVFLVGFVVAIFYFTGPQGLKSNMMESKYKYKIVYWLEEIARTLTAFKQAGTTGLPLRKMDELVNSYLHYRKAHFRILLTQFSNMLAFKTLVTGGLLIIGTILVVDRQITLGQFVASEVIIILVVGAVEKLIISMDVFYDLLTGVDKIAHVTDIPLERNVGLKIPLTQHETGIKIAAKNLKYRYKDNPKYTLDNLDFDILPGESVCIAGPNDSGKHTLIKVLMGFLDYEGSLLVNQFSLRDLHLPTVRDHMNKNLSLEEIFDGTILDNITMGRDAVKHQDVLWAIEHIGLTDYIASLPDGLQTHIGSTGKKLSGGVQAKLLLARSVASRPKLLIVHDFSEHLPKQDKLKILSFLREKSNGWTLIILSVSDDPMLLSSCDKIVLMNEGKIAAKGSYEQLLSDRNFQNLIFKSK